MSGDKQQMLNRLLTRLFFLPSAFKKLNFTQHLVLIGPLLWPTNWQLIFSWNRQKLFLDRKCYEKNYVSKF